MKRHVIHPVGPFSLAHPAASLAGSSPATGTSVSFEETGPTIRAAFPLDGDWRTVGVRINAPRDGDEVLVASSGAPSGRQVGERVARALALDLDASPLRAVAARDHVVAGLLDERPGFRPLGFWSPYHAAVWSVLSQRTSMAHASSVAAWLAAEHGEHVEVDGVSLAALPDPEVLADVDEVPGVPEVKVPRLVGIARAALDGTLDGARLRSLDADTARDDLLAIPGIGPFSADLVLLRGAQHPDVFSAHEVRLHQAMRVAYGRPDADLAELEEIAAGWSPVRSWVSVLVRIWAGDRPMVGA